MGIGIFLGISYILFGMFLIGLGIFTIVDAVKNK